MEFSGSTTAQPSSNWVRDDQVWLSDGNIIIIAQNIAFRIHKSILAQHSEVFRDIFSLPCSSVPEAVDGCEAVHVSDSAEDMRQLLLVLCCGKNPYYDLDEIIPVPFPVVASLVRMGHKYNVPGVLNPALARLKKYHPITLKAWRDTDGRARYVTSTDSHDAITAVQLARLTDTPSILPTAFLQCCDFADEVYPETHPQRGTFVLSAGLPPGDHATVISGQVLATRIAAGFVARLFLEIPRPGCASPNQCKQAVKGGVIQELASLSLAAGLRSGPAISAAGSSAAICQTCRRVLSKASDGIWSILPHCFHVSVDGWLPIPTS
ncbi:hypothetical protein K466DRAFT_603291 [Polyporus arcularius HHB13444]|uniref:BTB domain-containing protein n=1 Tax=Polyporus arcularius HHB13444 TaxID=1314778 RepID=A0A5C3P2R5_9APHY|nr:hypothetical protein K466DRAFT_603291 [Polyporus arcularius HHB13444]